VLSHPDSNKSIGELLALLRRGASVTFTIWGIRNPRLVGWPFGPSIPANYSPALVAQAVSEGFVKQLMLSIDYSAMKGLEADRIKEDIYEVPGRTHLYLFTHAIPSLKSCGVSDTDIETMLRDNPRRMLERE
jgi:predicted metal-dependent phosphotriesterase family hydrolase